MLAWPRSSWMTRRSAPCSSMCVAKLCRSMCGVMFRAMPACRADCLTRFHRAAREEHVGRRARIDERRPARGEMAVQRLDRLAPHGHDALLVALADDTEETGKGNKERVVPVGRKAVEAL